MLEEDFQCDSSDFSVGCGCWNQMVPFKTPFVSERVHLWIAPDPNQTSSLQVSLDLLPYCIHFEHFAPPSKISPLMNPWVNHTSLEPVRFGEGKRKPMWHLSMPCAVPTGIFLWFCSIVGVRTSANRRLPCLLTFMTLAPSLFAWCSCLGNQKLARVGGFKDLFVPDNWRRYDGNTFGHQKTLPIN